MYPSEAIKMLIAFCFPFGSNLEQILVGCVVDNWRFYIEKHTYLSKTLSKFLCFEAVFFSEANLHNYLCTWNKQHLNMEYNSPRRLVPIISSNYIRYKWIRYALTNRQDSLVRWSKFKCINKLSINKYAISPHWLSYKKC